MRANIAGLEELSYYWGDVRKYYVDFESGMNSPHSEIYVHEMPGGQYSNLQQQAKAVGLGDRWDEVKAIGRAVTRYQTGCRCRLWFWTAFRSFGELF